MYWSFSGPISKTEASPSLLKLEDGSEHHLEQGSPENANLSICDWQGHLPLFLDGELIGKTMALGHLNAATVPTNPPKTPIGVLAQVSLMTACYLELIIVLSYYYPGWETSAVHKFSSDKQFGCLTFPREPSGTPIFPSSLEARY
jgi:hypothetical protein